MSRKEDRLQFFKSKTMEIVRFAFLLVAMLLLLYAAVVTVKTRVSKHVTRNEEEFNQIKQQRTTLSPKERRENKLAIFMSARDATTIPQRIHILDTYKQDKAYRDSGSFKELLSQLGRKRLHEDKSRRKRDLGEGDTPKRGSPAHPGASANYDRHGGFPSNVLPTSTSDAIKKNFTADPTTKYSTAMITTDAPHPEINVSCQNSWLSCTGRCMEGRDPGQTKESYLQCYCDEHCETFTDCCYDYHGHCRNTSGDRHPITMQSNNQLYENNVWKCLPQPRNGPKGTSGIWMIASCPSEWKNTTIRDKCKRESALSYKNYQDNIPIVARDGKTYKNRFCSICHGISAKEISYFALEFSCDILPPSSYNTEKTMEFLSAHCSISWKPNLGIQRRYCYSDIINRCPKSASESLQNGCKNGPPGIVCSTYGVYYSRFKNVYCALCNYATSLICGPPVITGDCDNCAITGTIQFSVIMDLGLSSQTNLPAAGHQTKVSCPTGKVYDPHLELCRRGIANPLNQTDFNKYRICAWLINTTDTIDTFVDSHLSDKDEHHFLSGFVSSLRINKVFLSNAEVKLEGRKYRVLFDLEIPQSNKTGTTRRSIANHFTIDDLLQFTEPINLVIHSNNFTIIKVTTRRLSCIVIERFLRHEYAILPDPPLAVYINKTHEIFKRHDYYVPRLHNAGTNAITVCRMRVHLVCRATYTALSIDEVTWMPNMSFIWNGKGKVYDKGHYDRQNGTIWICTNFSSNGTRDTVSAEQYNQPLVVITIIGLSLSVILLFVLLVTYCIFSELRTLPGINLMNLSVSHLFAHLLWLLGSGLILETKLCTAISLVLHFMFLSSFVWMSIIAIDTWLAFTKNGHVTRMSSRSKRKRYLRSMAIGWLTPLIFCSICFALDQTNTVAIGYGGRKGCWIQNTSSNLYFFAVPMGVLLLINIVFFVLTVKAIRRTITNSQMATVEKKRKKSFGIYVRIAALMGFTWLFGFLSSVRFYFEYVFVISCTLQGVYMAVAFVFTNRVVRLYAELLSNNKSSPSHTVSPPHQRTVVSKKHLPSSPRGTTHNPDMHTVSRKRRGISPPFEITKQGDRERDNEQETPF